MAQQHATHLHLAADGQGEGERGRSLKEEDMDKIDIKAEYALRMLAKKEKLQTILCQPAYKHYLKGGIIGVLFGLCGITFLIWLLAKAAVPSWGFMVIGLVYIALLESMRNRDRLNALITLKEIEDKTRSEQGA